MIGIGPTAALLCCQQLRDWLDSAPLSSHSPSATAQRQMIGTRLTYQAYNSTTGETLLPFLGRNQANQDRETPKVELRQEKNKKINKKINQFLSDSLGATGR